MKMTNAPRLAMMLTALVIAASVIGGAPAGVSKESRERIEKDRPEVVIVTAIDGDDSAITIRGESGNVYAIANFVETIKADPRFTLPDVRYIREKVNSSPILYEFEFHFSVSAE